MEVAGAEMDVPAVKSLLDQFYNAPENPFYIGWSRWTGETHRGTHPFFVGPKIFARAQTVLAGHNRSKREIAFRGLIVPMTAACSPAMCRRRSTSITAAPGTVASATFRVFGMMSWPTGWVSR